MIALWIILGLIVLIWLLLMIPLRIFLHYEEDFDFRIKYGTITVFDSTKERPENKPDSTEKQKKSSDGIGKLLDFLGLSEISSIANAKHSVSSLGIVGTLQAVFSAVRQLFSRIFRLVRKGRFKKFRLSILVGDQDSGDAALQYGKVCAVAFPLLSLVKNVIHFSEQQVDIRCDYSLEETLVRFDGQLNYRPWHFVCFAMGLFVNYIKNSAKKENSHE
ncbi:MAG: hypothetical protein E7434_09115 [Ruminococcaceae bacterium]|nr:hypothetical protein [Oscillospiraceae bacterium]